MPQILDGKTIAAEIRAEIKDKLDNCKKSSTEYPCWDYTPPCLAVVLCDDNSASEIYVRRKREACAEVGINSYLLQPFEGGVKNWRNPKSHLLGLIDFLNQNSSVHGILVQLPLPKEIDCYTVFDRISPDKDVDVLNPVNVGLLVQNRPRFIPCTPRGIQELLSRSGIEIAGKKVAVINRSDVVGRPLSAMLSQDDGKANATVTVCHDHTPSDTLREVCLASDVIVVAVGERNFLTADMVTENSVVVDVGVNREPGSKKIYGDVDFPAVSPIVKAITPVPGGVGPMTVAMLLHNTHEAYRRQVGELNHWWDGYNYRGSMDG